MFFSYINKNYFKIAKKFAKELISKKLFICEIDFIYMFAKIKYQSYMKFQYGYYLEIFISWVSKIYKKEKCFNWRNRSDWAHQTYRNNCANFHSRQNWVH
jgi:hypothetical protein